MAPSLKVVLDKEVPVYAPGEEVKGNITLQTDKDIALKGKFIELEKYIFLKLFHQPTGHLCLDICWYCTISICG